jgi:hypothetical protein
MNAEAIVGDLQNEIKARLDSEEGMYVDKNLTGESYLKMVLRSIEALGIRLVPVGALPIGSTYAYDFARIVHSWNAQMEKFSEEDVNPEQVILALQSEGWTLIPPGY